MKALVFKRYGKSAQPEYADIPGPTIGPDEILVQVHAVGLNPIDNIIPKGTFKPVLRFELPATIGSDVAGVVAEVGSGVIPASGGADSLRGFPRRMNHDSIPRP
ncbi:alcohol dehydrogenase catalytic domain-containing protein [Azospirillum sp. A29]|uniref:alcohol dehydrogenase catalytic domain-containing protein n=1 Tax=Azospirillum sp. A29 TaxID=3160606 RepID=UPI00366E81E8